MWELVATESEDWRFNCPGNMTACGSVGHIHHHSATGGRWSRREPGRSPLTWEWNSTGLPSLPVILCFPVGWLLKARSVDTLFNFIIRFNIQFAIWKIKLQFRIQNVIWKRFPPCSGWGSKRFPDLGPGLFPRRVEQNRLYAAYDNKGLIYQDVYAVAWEILTDREGKRAWQLNTLAPLEDIWIKKYFDNCLKFNILSG